MAEVFLIPAFDKRSRMDLGLDDARNAMVFILESMSYAGKSISKYV